MKYNTKLTFKIFWQHALKYKLAMIVIFLSVTTGAAFGVSTPYFYKKFFDALTNNGTKGDLLHVLFFIFLTMTGEWFFWRIAAFVNAYFQTKMMGDLAVTCFKYLHKHSFGFFNNNFVGSLVKRVNRFYRAFEGIADRFTWDLLPILTNIILIIIILAKRSVYLGLAIIVWIIIYCVINYLFTIYKLKYDVERSKWDSKVTGVLADTITNNSNIKLFVGYNREVKNFAGVTEKLNRLRKFTWDLSNIFEGFQVMFMIALEIGIFYIAINLWFKKALTIGDFVLIQSYILTIFMKLWDFGRVVRNFYENLADAEEMTEVLNTPHGITDVKNAKKLLVKEGGIKFNKVNFFYHQTRPVFENFNLNIIPREKIALVGPSGAGKTTIVKLLLRMHDVSQGEIVVDGQNIAKVTQESLWQNISMVPQDPILFHRSLLENIRYGKPDANDKEVFKAAKLAHCHEFISEFPDGYETKVGERGIKLSGGERQRVAIARAILRNAPILVLDEATSSLDSESESLIQDALDVLMKNKTVIVIAHRLSTIMKVDRILVVAAGGILEQGTHTELLAKKDGLYQKLWKIQAGGFIR